LWVEILGRRTTPPEYFKVVVGVKMELFGGGILLGCESKRRLSSKGQTTCNGGGPLRGLVQAYTITGKARKGGLT